MGTEIAPVRKSRRRFVKSIVGTALVSTEATASGPALITLIEAGARPRMIFVSADASASEKWAADELARVLEEMTSVRLAVTSSEAKSPGDIAFVIGGKGIAGRMGLRIPDGESCLLKTVAQTLVIAGGRQRGTLYGVFVFLEKMGCRWFTSDVARLPKLSRITLPALNEVSAPAFAYREVFFTEAQGKEWSARNRLNGNFHKLDASVGGRIRYQPFAHSFYDLVPPDVHFERHPEYFALVAGARRRESAQLCLTNPDVVQLAIRQIRQWLTDEPDINVVSVSQNDGAGWCECNSCRQIVKEEGNALSGLLLRFVNRVAASIAKSNRGIMVDTLAYQGTADPPRRARPLRNVQIRLCPIDACQAHSYESCRYNRRFQERCAQWQQVAPKLYLWLYSVNFSHYLAPFPDEQELVQDIPRFRLAGVSGIFVEGAVSDGGGGEDAELRSWLAARLLWNSHLDARAEIDEFLEGVYGPAAPPIRQYFLLRHREISQGEHLWFDQNVNARYLTDGFLVEAQTLLKQAWNQAESDAARKRIDRHRLSIDYVKTVRGWQYFAQGSDYAPRDLALARLTTQQFVKHAQTLGITHLREGYPLAEQSQSIERALQKYSVVTLADSKLSVQVVPESGGRVIAMRPADSSAENGLNAVRVANPGELSYPHAGGLCFRLSSDYFGPSQDVTWHSVPLKTSAFLLRGNSSGGHDLLLELGLNDGTLTMELTVSNPGSVAIRTAVRCQSEFALGTSQAAWLRFTSRTGSNRVHRIDAGNRPEDGSLILSNATLPGHEWVLDSPDLLFAIRNSFAPGDVARAAVRWSFRGEMVVSLALWSPEVKLSPGDNLRLRHSYRLVEHRS